jgi:uncharacterized protein (DUF433 family)
MRITVGTILTLLRHQTPEEILRDYPYLEREVAVLRQLPF